MRRMDKVEFTKDDVGCLVEASDGVNTIIGMLLMADLCGYPFLPSDNMAFQAFEKGNETFTDMFGIQHETPEWVLKENGLADKVLAWLNSDMAPEGTVFHWYSGSLYLSEIPDEVVAENNSDG